jgi:fermentation-respiration switch protein FrsA (DUF1100 family)
MKRWHKITLGIVAGIVVVALVGLALVTRAMGREFVHNPPEDRDSIVETPADYGLPYEDVVVTTADGLNLVGWYVPSQNGAAIIAQHGYKSDRQHVLLEAAFLHQRGYGVLLSTVRAHDLSDGEMITMGDPEMRDLEAWYQYLLTREDVDPDKIGLYGESMGGAMAIRYAGQNAHIKTIVVHSALPSLNDVVEMAVPYYTGFPAFPFAPLAVFWAEREADIDASEIDARVWIQDVHCPILILQGGADDHIPAESGQWLYDAANEPKEYYFEPGAGHTGLDEEPFAAAYEQRVVAFFDRYLLGE